MTPETTTETTRPGADALERIEAVLDRVDATIEHLDQPRPDDATEHPSDEQ